MRGSFELKVHLACDEETGRWYVAESDIPGLWLEADDPIHLIERIKVAAPELIELNIEEIMEAYRAREDDGHDPHGLKPSLLPVFDTPLALAHA